MPTVPLYGDEHDLFDDDADQRGDRAVVLRVSQVAAEQVRWLWPGRIPAGKLTVLDGDPGLGKSTLLLDLAARISTGSPLPTGERPDHPRGVLLLSAEDGVGDTIRPRLEAAGADLDRALVLEVSESPQEDGGPRLPRPPSIPGDVGLLERTIVEHRVSLVVIDPLMAYFGGQTDSHRDQDVRRALHPLSAMAGRTGAAVVVVRHLAKSGGAHPIYRGGGSIGIIGAARAGLLVAPDPSDDTRRILAVTKSNLAAMPPALAFRLTSDDLRGVARIQWEGATEHRAADLLIPPAHEGEKGAIAEAVDFLVDLLSGGPIPARDGKAAARDAGIADRTLDEGRKRLGIKPRREGFGAGGTWWWDPPIDADLPIGAKDRTSGTNGQVGIYGASKVCAYCAAPAKHEDDEGRPWCTECPGPESLPPSTPDAFGLNGRNG